MGPKKEKVFSQRKPRKDQKPRTQPAIHVSEESKIQILSMVNDKRYSSETDHVICCLLYLYFKYS